MVEGVSIVHLKEKLPDFTGFDTPEKVVLACCFAVGVKVSGTQCVRHILDDICCRCSCGADLDSGLSAEIFQIQGAFLQSCISTYRNRNVRKDISTSTVSDHVIPGSGSDEVGFECHRASKTRCSPGALKHFLRNQRSQRSCSYPSCWLVGVVNRHRSQISEVSLNSL